MIKNKHTVHWGQFLGYLGVLGKIFSYSFFGDYWSYISVFSLKGKESEPLIEKNIFFSPCA